MQLVARDVEDEEGKSPRMPDIKLANEQQERKRVKARKKIKNLGSQLTSEAKC